MCKKVMAIKAWAYKYYGESYGASVLIECYSSDELDKEFESLEAAKEFAGLQDEMKANAAWSGPGGPEE